MLFRNTVSFFVEPSRSKLEILAFFFFMIYRENRKCSLFKIIIYPRDFIRWKKRMKIDILNWNSVVLLKNFFGVLFPDTGKNFVFLNGTSVIVLRQRFEIFLILLWGNTTLSSVISKKQKRNKYSFIYIMNKHE